MSDRDALLAQVTKKAVVHGAVTLSSGRQADYYVDLRRITLDAQAAPLVGRVMLDLTDDWDYDAVGGLTLGADPVATSMLHAAAARGRELDAFVVRKEEKTHGLQRRIEGPDIEGRRVLAVEDTSTTGGSVLTAVDALRAAGAEVVGVAVIVDRSTGAKEKVEAAGCPTGSRSGSTTSGCTSSERARREGDFLVAAESAIELIGRVEVVRRWDDPSALAHMSVGGLAAHLGDQILPVHAAVTAGTNVTDDEPISLLDHYDRVAWANSDIDDPSNVTIREGAEEHAEPGHDRLVASLQHALRDIRTAFEALVLPPAISMPWWDWSLSFDDYLVGRVMEIVVHNDDLAVSVDTPPPVLPEPVLGPVLALLVGISLNRHGQAAVVRALSRSERAGDISAF